MTSTKTYKEKNHLGISLTIQYTDKIESVIDLKTLNLFFQDIYENTRRYMGSKVLDGLDLEIWDDLCEDIPKNKEVCDLKTKQCKVVSYGVGNYAGLTWASINQMDLNDNLFGQSESERHKHMSNLLSHEVGHYIAHKILKFDQADNPMKDFWLKFRGIDEKPGTSMTELIAEDLRQLFGSRLAKAFRRGDYIQAEDKVGLLSIYQIWFNVLHEYYFYKQYCNVTNFQVKLGNGGYFVLFDIDYFNPFWKLSNKRIMISTDGIYHISKNGSSTKIRSI